MKKLYILTLVMFIITSCNNFEDTLPKGYSQPDYIVLKSKYDSNLYFNYIEYMDYAQNPYNVSIQTLDTIFYDYIYLYIVNNAYSITPEVIDYVVYNIQLSDTLWINQRGDYMQPARLHIYKKF